MKKRESNFQAKLIKELKDAFHGCFIQKNDAGYVQGIPDLLILFKDKWAMLEVKKSEDAPHRPNQDFYIKRFSDMSFASFISPETKDEVIRKLKIFFES